MTVPAPTPWLFTLFACLLFPACKAGTQAAANGQFTVIDSAGVTIVDHATGALAAAPVFMLGDRIASIGGVDADSLHDPSSLRTGLFIAPGILLMIDRPARRLVEFDSLGNLIATYGRRGEGPQDFRYPPAPHLLPSGELRVVDLPGRLVRLSRDVRFIADAPIGPRGSVLGEWTILFGDTAGLIVESGDVYFRSLGDEPRRSPVQLLRVGSTRIDTVGTWGGSWAIPAATSDPGTFEMSSLELGPDFVHAATQDRLAIGTADRWTIELRDARGVLRTLIRLHEPARPVTIAMRDSIVARERQVIAHWDGPAAETAAAMARLKHLHFADSLPPYEEFVGALDGALWVAEMVAPTDSLRYYAVFAPDGKLKHRVVMKKSERVVAATPSLVAIRWIDSDGLGHLEIAKLSPANK